YEILGFAQERGFGVRGLTRSPVLGPKGNVEFLVWLGTGIPPADREQIEAMIDAAAPPAEEVADDE
ncbi:MAG: hypothetical protein L3J16_05505, partial [Anaerolineales bacterium]|nr:hypothetical protein [Anaerolineales bacterium]